MRGQKRVFVIDFDNTLFDIERFKNSLIGKFSSKSSFAKLYKNAKKESGHFNPKNLPENYKKLFTGANFHKYLFPKSKEGIKELKKIGKVIVFSFGDFDYQTLKIGQSGIEKIAGKKNVLIVQDKKEGVEKLIRGLKKEKYTDITIIDDVSEVLEKAFEKSLSVNTIWIRYGKYKNKLPVMRNSVTFETQNFLESVNFVKRLVTTISLPKTHLKYPVMRGIENGEISDLVSYTGRDKKISICTHDDGRFKNRRTFTAWQKRGKIIYTLVNRTGKLLGLIWFARKKYRSFHYTIAVRTYPPIRGKGLSYKFMKSVTDDFFKNHKNTGIWLSMQKGNIPAEKLYKKFGFKIIEDRKGEVVMTYEV